MTLNRRHVLAGFAATPFALSPVWATGTPRIVSVGGSVTETLYFLNRQNLIVGADTTSSFPVAAGELPKVGYIRNLSAEGVLSLNPSMVIAEEDIGPPPTVESLELAGVDIRIVPNDYSIQGVIDKTQSVADLVDAKPEADVLVQAVSDRAAKVEAAVAGLSTRPRVLFVLALRDGSIMAAGRDTAAESIIAMAGGELIFDSFDGYKPVSLESIHAAQPDVILLMQHVANRMGGVAKVAQTDPIASLDAAKNGRVMAMNGLLMLGFGPRTPDAALALARILHGEGAVPELPGALMPA